MKSFLIKAGDKPLICERDPRDTGTYNGNKTSAKEELLKLNQEIEALQESLYAEHKHKILVVLQGMDTSGKDGVCRTVFDGVNPQGVRVASFKAPTSDELDHDFLWRIHKQVPAKGEIVIFNRSHYEDVLIVRVHEIIDQKECKRRYNQINEFEKMLSDQGVTILKFFLYISKDEQKTRLMERLERPEKNWKFNPGDIDERRLWDTYIDAYESAIEATSTNWAPWYIVPADRKWFRDLFIARIIVDTLYSLKIQAPPVIPDPEKYIKMLENS